MLAAAVQLTSTSDAAHNLRRAEHWIARAAGHGAQLVALPENFPLMREEGDAGPHPLAADLEHSEPLRFLREQARRFGVTLGGGTIPERVPGEPRIYNTAVLVGPSGELLASYRKIHLFDVDLPGVSLRESRGVAPGDKAVSAATPLGRIGLSVCYDLRFPELYRALVDQGAELLLVPSAFTVPTGSAHWEVLLRARAIESQAFVIAPGQCGEHNRSRRSYGHSMIVDPWGVVLAQAPEGEGLALAEIDLARVSEVRRRLPALSHRRL
jgi:nitrilase